MPLKILKRVLKTAEPYAKRVCLSKINYRSTNETTFLMGQSSNNDASRGFLFSEVRILGYHQSESDRLYSGEQVVD